VGQIRLALICVCFLCVFVCVLGDLFESTNSHVELVGPISTGVSIMLT